MREQPKPPRWPAALVAAVKAELQGNAARDLLGWAHRTVDAHAARRPVAKADLQRARLVLDVKRSEAPANG